MLGLGLEFVLFAILGWCVFAPPSSGRQILMIVYVVLMILWLVGIGVTASGVGGWHLFGNR